MPGCAGAVTVICALPVALESAWLIATSVTLSGCGCTAGARYSTVFSGPEGAAHGFEAGAHTCPTVPFPFGTPFTVHVTAELDVFETLAVKFALWPVITVADAGDTVTLIDALATMETVAVALCVPAVASIFTEAGDGTAAGAV
jgi:hypothetical protein